MIQHISLVVNNRQYFHLVRVPFPRVSRVHKKQYTIRNVITKNVLREEIIPIKIYIQPN